jgi:hypothetical protein
VSEQRPVSLAPLEPACNKPLRIFPSAREAPQEATERTPKQRQIIRRIIASTTSSFIRSDVLDRRNPDVSGLLLAE